MAWPHLSFIHDQAVFTLAPNACSGVCVFHFCNFHVCYAFIIWQCLQRRYVLDCLSICRIHLFVHLFVRSSGQILLPRYLMNGLSNLDETLENIYCPVLMTWLDFGGQRSRSQQAVTKASTSMLEHRSPSSSLLLQSYSRVGKSHKKDLVWME